MTPKQKCLINHPGATCRVSRMLVDHHVADVFFIYLNGKVQARGVNGKAAWLAFLRSRKRRRRNKRRGEFWRNGA